ncbi:hypothetical protein BH24CHL4_BH24CHL4_06030 [soil metagenome]
MPSSLGGHNALSAAAIAGSMVLGVIVLWFVARDAPSTAIGEIGAVPRASITVSGGCQNFADYWLNETSVDIEPATLEGFTNCRQGEEGKWYVWTELPAPDGSQLDELSEEDRSAAGELKARILEDIDALQVQISPELQAELDKVYGETQNPVIGQVREGASLSNVRTRYARLVNAFALNPDREALADFVAWSMERRINAYGVFRRACLDEGTVYLLHPCVGMEDNLSIRYAPWYWALRNPLLLDAYVADLFAEDPEPE